MAKLLIRFLLAANLIIAAQLVWPMVARKDAQEHPAKAQLSNLIERLDSGPVYDLRKRSLDGRRATLAILVNRVSSTCASGQLLEFADRNASRVPLEQVVAIVPNNFTELEAHNLRQTLGLSFDVVVASDELSNEWLRLAKDYSEPTVNGLVAVFENGEMELLQGAPQLKSRLGL